jgi:hypothetical protein
VVAANQRDEGFLIAGAQPVDQLDLVGGRHALSVGV